MIPNIHSRAEELVRESHGKRTLPEAYAELSRRGHASKRWRNGGILHPVCADRAAFDAVESPRYWWNSDL